MRISTAQLSQISLQGMLDQQAKLLETQQQLSTGKTHIKPSDDPSAASQSLGMDEALKTTEQYQKNIDYAESKLRTEESVLSGLNTLLNRVRELALQGNNSSVTDSDRRLLALEVRQRLDELLNIANTRDPGGEYIFSGYQSTTTPYALNGTGGVIYAGDQGQRHVQIGSSRQIAVTDSGHDVFTAIRNGNGTFVTQAGVANAGTGVIDAGSVFDPTAYVQDTYTITFITGTTYEVRDSLNNLVASGAYVNDGPITFNGQQVSISGSPVAGDTFTASPSANQDIFTTINNLVTAFETGASDSVGLAVLNNNINRFLVDIDQANENILSVRASVGSRLNSLDGQRDMNASQNLNVQERLSELNDLDYIEAISRLDQQRVGLEAAQKSYMQIQNLSLFNYI